MKFNIGVNKFTQVANKKRILFKKWQIDFKWPSLMYTQDFIFLSRRVKLTRKIKISEVIRNPIIPRILHECLFLSHFLFSVLFIQLRSFLLNFRFRLTSSLMAPNAPLEFNLFSYKIVHFVYYFSSQTFLCKVYPSDPCFANHPPFKPPTWQIFIPDS